MKLLIYLSDFIIPFTVLFIVADGVLKKVSVFDEFVNGAKNGVKIVAGIMPTLVGLMVAVGIFRASGMFEVIAKIVAPLAGLIHFPKSLVPLSIVKMFSSSAATGLLLDVYKESGADSYEGQIASIMMSCTETVFYTMSVYFMAAKVKKTRWTLAGALLSTAAGMAMAVLLAR